jgi:hypothetical protein
MISNEILWTALQFVFLLFKLFQKHIYEYLWFYPQLWALGSNIEINPVFTMNAYDSVWLIDYLRFYVSLNNFSLILRCHHCRWRAAKFRPMLGAQGLWAGRDLYRATPAVTRDLGFSGLIRRTASFSRLLRHTRGRGESILTQILTSLILFDVGWLFTV